MLTILIYLIVGIAFLSLGADRLVRGSSSIALRLGLSPLVIGLTIVAFGTSMPELVVSSQAALDRHGEIALGNVIGSNIFNIAVILGLTALIQPLKVNLQVLRLDMPAMIFTSLLFVLFFRDHSINRGEGLILFLGILGYTALTFYLARREAKKGSELVYQESIPSKGKKVTTDLLWIATGFSLLILGSHLFVQGSIDLARMWGVSEAIIGLTIVALGTSLPELATSLVAALHKEVDIAIGNIVGSNLFNLLCILGISSLLMPVEGTAISAVDIGMMIGTAVLLLPFMWTGFALSRWEGLVLLCGYSGYLFYLWPK
ncbi:MAG: calcium/sodium antiporter [Chloroflexota bacterium]|nr:calcium/sodium antiporter [Chloroflexota bacterium]